MFRPRLETLEARANPAVTAAMVGLDLVVTGTSSADNITVNSTNPAATTVGGVPGPFNIPAGGVIRINALGGNDVVQVSGSVPAYVNGGDGNDTITGGLGDDVLRGGAGGDFIQGGTGNDVIEGGTGIDRLSGDAGDDVLIGGQSSHSDDDLATQKNDPGLPGTVTDTEQDRMTGSGGADRFIKNAGDIVTDPTQDPGDTTETV